MNIEITTIIISILVIFVIGQRSDRINWTRARTLAGGRITGKALLPALFLLAAAAVLPVSGQDVDPYKAAAAQGPSLADYPLSFEVTNQRNMINGVQQYVGWKPVIQGRILGRTRSGDAVTIELSQGGKVLRSLRVGLRGNRGETWYEEWTFRGDDTKDLMTAVGPVTATFKYLNDLEGTTVPLSVRKFNVIRLADYDGSKSVWKYGMVYDDLLGLSYLVQRQPNSGNNAGVWIYTWMNLEHDSVLKDISYRIEVDGKVVPLDDNFDANQNRESVSSLGQEEALFVKARNDRIVNKHNLYLVTFRPQLLWGPKPETGAIPNWMYLVDHPGKRSLKIRIAGDVVRELRFSVLSNGQIQPHPEQNPTAQGFLNLGPGRFFAETYFPNPNTFDIRFNPDAIRDGSLYGRPWTSTDVKDGMLKVLPPKNAGKLPFPQTVLPPY